MSSAFALRARLQTLRRDRLRAELDSRLAKTKLTEGERSLEDGYGS
jgi:hypothetical protein